MILSYQKIVKNLDRGKLNNTADLQFRSLDNRRDPKNKTVWDNIDQIVNSRQSVLMPGQKPGTSNTKGTFN